MKNFLIILSGLLLLSCSTEKNSLLPGIVPNSAKDPKIVRVAPNNIIGAVEKIYLPPMKSPFLSRIDTGATTSSLDAEDVKFFERDGKSWIAFKIVNRSTQETYTFEKPLIKRIKIRRIGEKERRPIVSMDVKMGSETFKADFTIAEREKFEYQTLIGRNILNGRAIVDVSISNTLK
ncbi:MAG: ATP-dependent zinc protease [Alphaproteobacteria bacterium]|nr:ATP-dependent zinc protease [Alphaproteobacteria bacterium]